MDNQGSVCLRPSQAAIILYGLVSKESIDCERKEKLVRIFLENLQENHSSETELVQMVQQLFDRENRFLSYRKYFEETQQELKETIEKDVAEHIGLDYLRYVEKGSDLDKLLNKLERNHAESIKILQ